MPRSEYKKEVRRRHQRYWKWFARALFLLLTLDILTTLLATAVYGTDAEINPFMVWLIELGPVVLILVHLLALVGVTLAFSQVIKVIESVASPADVALEVLLEIWLGLLLTAGFVIVINNLFVIVFGRSVVTL